MNWFKKNTIPIFILLLVSTFLYVPFIGIVHLFDWDEINFAECAREMLVTNDYLTVKINYLPFWEKPPLFIWMQAISMKLFGVNEFAARFPNAVCGFFTLLTLYFLGKRLYDKKFAFIWVLSYVGSILPFVYFKSGIIDPWFNLLIFAGVYNFSFIYFTEGSVNKNIRIIFAALFIALAVMTKGPVALLILGLTAFIFFVLNKFRLPVNIFQIVLFLVVFVLVGGFWFLLQILNGNYETVKDFIVYQAGLFSSQVAGHGGFFGYHFVVVLFGVFPTSIYAIRGFANIQQNTVNQQIFKQWMLILLLTVLILFSIVKTKIVHYSSLTYFPVTYLAAYAVYKTGNIKSRYKNWITWLVAIFGILLTIIVASLPFIDQYKELIIENIQIKDAFALENFKAQVDWSGNEWLVSLVLLLGIIVYLVITRWRFKIAYYIITITTAVFTFLTVVIMTPKIEKYSQNAAIEFYDSISNQDCYVKTLGYKSYAHLFYSKMNPPTNKNWNDLEWLIYGEIDKPVYFVTKINKKESILGKYPTLDIMYEKNGFVFLKRYYREDN